jgi:MoxR-like ATPase
MIILDDRAPRWLREVGRFLNLKNLIFLYGNIHDLVSYPVEGGADCECQWSQSRLRDLLRRLLEDRGYEVVGLGDPVEELRFGTPEMERKFREVASAATTAARSSDAAGNVGGESSSGTSPRLVAGTRRAGPRVDWAQVIDELARVMQNPHVPCAFVMDLASRLVASPDSLGDGNLAIFTKLLKASLGGATVIREGGRWNNLIILVCDKLNDLPPFLYLGNPQARSIRIDLPDREDRRRFIRQRYCGFHGIAGGADAPPEPLVADFVDLTEGLTNMELSTLVGLSRKERVSVLDPSSGASNVRRIIELYRYGVQVSKWDQVEVSFTGLSEKLREKVKGQDEAISRVLEIVSRARLGLAAGESQRSQRPRGVLFFAGPTGVGKTQMAKVLAECLLGEENRLIRFDMSEYASAHADQRLLGAPPGYVGHEEGGQLTDAVKQHPFSVLLFDEIDKANGKIFDKFLQILDDGRLTDGRGETTYFSECLIIFTSNIGADRLPVDTAPSYPEIERTIMDAIRDKFNRELGRPEILNRFGDSFVIFDFIRPPTHMEIVDKFVRELQIAAREKRRIVLELSSDARETLIQFAATRLNHGGRGIRTAVDTALVDPLALELLKLGVKPPGRARVEQLRAVGPTSKRWEAVVTWVAATPSL